MVRTRPTISPLSPLGIGLLGLHQLSRCLAGLEGVPCFILEHRVRTGRIAWWPLVRDDRRLRPFDFDFRVGRPEIRDDYHRRNLWEARRTGRPQNAQLFGMSDLYVPISITSASTLVLYAGQYAERPFTPATLTQAFRELSSRDPGATDPIFHRFVRACLGLPILHPEQVRGLTELGAALASLDTNLPLGRVQRTIERLKKRRFSAHAVDHEWVNSAIDLDGLTRPPWGLDPELDPRLVEELGLTRRPSVIALLALDRSRTRWSSVEELSYLCALQHAAARHCRELHSCLAAPLEGEGVILALSLDGTTRGTQRRRRFVALVRELMRRLARDPGLATIAGLGLEVVPGAGLGESYRQATVALGAARARTQTLCVYDPVTPPHVPARAQLRRDFEALAAELSSEQGAELRLRAMGLARSVLCLESHDPNAVRVWLLSALDLFLGTLERDGVLLPALARDRRTLLEAEFSSLRTTSGLIEGFELAMTGLFELLARRRLADRDQRLSTALTWAKQNLGASSVEEQAARRAGLASASFRRAFRAARGQSFGAWLRELRLEEAARILARDEAPLAQVAERVGLGEVHTLIRGFRRRFGTTPAAYRRRVMAGD